MKRNIAVLFIFAIIFVLIGEAQSARYGGSSASAPKSSVSVAPASSKTISFSSSTTKAASTTITQPKGNNSLTNNYKAQAAENKTSTNNVTSQSSSSYSPINAPQLSSTNTKHVYPTSFSTTANTTTNSSQSAPVSASKVVVVEKQPKIVEVHHYNDNSNSALSTLATWSIMDSMMNRDRNSSEYKEWRYKAEREAAENAELRRKLAAFDAEAASNMPVAAQQEVAKTTQSSGVKPVVYNNNKNKVVAVHKNNETSIWTLTIFVLGMCILCVGMVVLAKAINSSKERE